MARSLKDFLAQKSESFREAVEARTIELSNELQIGRVRAAMGQTQTELADFLGQSQAAISKLERQSDMLISTLRRYIEAVGGTLKISANFHGATVEFDNLSEIVPISGTFIGGDIQASQIESSTETFIASAEIRDVVSVSNVIGFYGRPTRQAAQKSTPMGTTQDHNLILYPAGRRVASLSDFQSLSRAA